MMNGISPERRLQIRDAANWLISGAKARDAGVGVKKLALAAGGAVLPGAALHGHDARVSIVGNEFPAIQQGAGALTRPVPT